MSNQIKEMTYQQDLAVSADAAWPVLEDFGGFIDWNPMDVPYTVEGDGIGMVRIMDIPGLGRLGERLDHIDAAAKTLSYTLTEGEPLGMQTYAAQLRLEATGDTSSTLHWVGRFTGADGADLEEMATNLAGSYANMSSRLEAYVQAGGKA